MRLIHIIFVIVMIPLGITAIRTVIHLLIHTAGEARRIGAAKTVLGIVIGLALAALLYLFIYNLPVIITWLTEPI